MRDRVHQQALGAAKAETLDRQEHMGLGHDVMYSSDRARAVPAQRCELARIAPAFESAGPCSIARLMPRVKASVSSGAVSTPSRPSLIRSGIPPVAAATTGVPVAQASRITVGVPSPVFGVSRDGTTRTAARASPSAISSFVSQPLNRTLMPSRVARD